MESESPNASTPTVTATTNSAYVIGMTRESGSFCSPLKQRSVAIKPTTKEQKRPIDKFVTGSLSKTDGSNGSVTMVPNEF